VLPEDAGVLLVDAVACGTVRALPALSASTASRYVMSPTQSQPSSSELAKPPSRYSPPSKKVWNQRCGLGSPYGTAISAIDAR